MNWGALLQVLVGILEKNPALIENLVTALLHLLSNNPAVLNKAVTVGLAHAEQALTVPVVPIAPTV